MFGWGGSGGTATAACEADAERAPDQPWLLVGAPNVGKSALFGRLTGTYATVSNYPGTSVDVASGPLAAGPAGVRVTDAPGIHALLAITEEERVARRALLGGAGTVIHVVDAARLERSIPLTLQLLALGRPLVVAANLMDEARAQGVAPDLALLAERLGVPVVGTVATTGEGVEALVAAAASAGVPEDGWGLPQPFAEPVRQAAGADAAGAAMLRAELALAGDAECAAALTGPALEAARAARDAGWGGDGGFALDLATARRAMTLALLDGVVPADAPPRSARAQAIDSWLLAPVPGFLVVALVLAAGFYGFVGRVGAGVLVDWCEDVLFGRWVEPAAAALAAAIPWAVVRDLVTGPYGLVPLGLRYAVAIVLPIVGTFFLVFALLEDSGYLPRLALLLDRGFKRIGLSGRAVIPLVLGFGCNTMATLVTRTLESRRERVITTLLLAITIPCSAQLGVVLGILSVSPAGLAVWVLTMLAVFLAVGLGAATLMPGKAPAFYLELPPLRVPTARNVLLKTGTRMRWYFAEIFPLFMLASVLLWAGDLTGVLQRATGWLVPVVRLIGLPAEAAPAFLYGFFRRDFGAAGLYDLAARGALDAAALTTAAVTITLFVPCVAQFLVMKRERGLGMALAVLVTATVTAFLVGGLVGAAIRGLGGLP